MEWSNRKRLFEAMCVKPLKGEYFHTTPFSMIVLMSLPDQDNYRTRHSQPAMGGEAKLEEPELLLPYFIPRKCQYEG
jgi:hypothetical protein